MQVVPEDRFRDTGMHLHPPVTMNPWLAARPKTQPRMEEKQRVRDIQDAEFKEIE